jgi:hypothetical protein
MFSLASSSILVSTQRADIPSSPTPRSDDDDQVELILMMGMVSLASSSSSSSSSDSSVSESARAPSVRFGCGDLFCHGILGSELQTFPKMTELESTRHEVELR